MKSSIESKSLNQEYIALGGTFKEISNIDDKSTEAIYAVGYNLYQAGKYDDAKNIFQFLSYYDHYNSKFFTGLGACFMMNKEYTKAIELFSYACALNKLDPKNHIYMGDCYLNKGEKENAVKSFHKAKIVSENIKEYKVEYKKSCSMLKNLSN